MTLTNIQPAAQLTVEDYRQRMDEAWAYSMRIQKPAHQVNNCPSDVQARDQAHRRWQDARHRYLEACKMDGVEP